MNYPTHDEIIVGISAYYELVFRRLPTKEELEKEVKNYENYVSNRVSLINSKS